MTTESVRTPPPASSPSPAPPAPSGEPLNCPLCEYDLRATTEERCPECGYRFNWDELRDPARRLHAYAFEHHPERNVWSFFRTLFAGLRPGRFWRTLFPTQPSRPRRLVLYWLIVAAACLAVSALQLARGFVALDEDMAARRAASVGWFARMPAGDRANILAQYGTAQAWAAAQSPRWPDGEFVRWWLRHNQATCVTAILWLTWPWVTLAGLTIFQASMRRARVRSIHVLRCVLYTADVALWWSLIALAVISLDAYTVGLVGQAWGLSDRVIVLVAATPVVLLLATYRLGRAYQLYLRFDHAFATAIAVQLMVFLLVVKLAMDWEYLVG